MALTKGEKIIAADVIAEDFLSIADNTQQNAFSLKVEDGISSYSKVSIDNSAVSIKNEKNDKSGELKIDGETITFNGHDLLAGSAGGVSGEDFYSGSVETGEHDANNMVNNGVYTYTSNGAPDNLPKSTYGSLYAQASDEKNVRQISQDKEGNLFVRGSQNGSWGDWNEVIINRNTYRTSNISCKRGWAMEGGEAYGGGLAGYYCRSGGISNTGNIALGYKTNSNGRYSFAGGYSAVSSGRASFAYGADMESSDTSFRQTKALGNTSIAMGQSALAEKDNSVAIGYRSESSANGAIVIGFSRADSNATYSLAAGFSCHTYAPYTTAIGLYASAGESGKGASATAMGVQTVASGGASFAVGYYSKATGCSGYASDGYFATFAEGYYTEATGNAAHAAGICTKADRNQFVIGHYNYARGAHASAIAGTSDLDAFIVGNGASTSSRSNAMRIDYNGKIWCKQAYSSTGADYAELFEWKDGNPESEDRRGYFVTMDGLNIKKATAEDDYILGVVSALPSVVGNSDEEWLGRYIMDDFGSYIYETIEVEQTENVVVVDKDGNEILDENGMPTFEEKVIKREVQRYKENPNYDPDRPYTDRLHRPEWDAVGMMGVLAVRQDGTAVVNGYVCPNNDGIATACEKSHENSFRVAAIVNEKVAKIIIK